MARRPTAKPKQKKIEKVDAKDKICKKCKHAYLMRSLPFNPIVCECTRSKERFVASTPHAEDCGFEVNKDEIVIHPMIYVK